jgi:DNA polymerase-3 subunit beta
MTSFAVTAADLHAAAGWVARVIPTRPTAPVLAGMHLTADGDTLTLAGTDWDTTARATITARVTTPGVALLPGRLVADIAGVITRPDTEVTFDITPSGAELRCGRSVWRVPALPDDDYPALPDVPAPQFEVGADRLREAAARVLVAVDRNAVPAAPALAGVNLEPADGGLTLVATDRYRLCADTIPVDAIPGGALPVVAPAELLAAAVRMPTTGTVGISTAGGVIGLTTPTHRLVGRQIAEQFPAGWRGLINRGSTRVRVVVAELVAAVDQARVMHDKGRGALELLFEPATARVLVSAVDSNSVGGADTDASLLGCDGPPCQVLVSPDYLRDALGGAPGETVVVHVSDRMLVFEPDAADESPLGWLHLVMGRSGTGRT